MIRYDNIRFAQALYISHINSHTWTSLFTGSIVFRALLSNEVLVAVVSEDNIVLGLSGGVGFINIPTTTYNTAIDIYV